MGVFLSKFKEIYFPKPQYLSEVIGPNTQKKRPDIGLRRFRRRKSFKYHRVGNRIIKQETNIATFRNPSNPQKTIKVIR